MPCEASKNLSSHRRIVHHPLTRQIKRAPMKAACFHGSSFDFGINTADPLFFYFIRPGHNPTKFIDIGIPKLAQFFRALLAPYTALAIYENLRIFRRNRGRCCLFANGSQRKQHCSWNTATLLVLLLNHILWASLELRRLSPDQRVSPQFYCQKMGLID